MVRPVNGQGYENYIYNHYFDLRVMGAAAADRVTLSANNAIKLIPERVSLNDRAVVEAARAAYNKIATTEQQALVSNYYHLRNYLKIHKVYVVWGFCVWMSTIWDRLFVKPTNNNCHWQVLLIRVVNSINSLNKRYTKYGCVNI